MQCLDVSIGRWQPSCALGSYPRDQAKHWGCWQKDRETWVLENMIESLNQLTQSCPASGLLLQWEDTFFFLLRWDYLLLATQCNLMDISVNRSPVWASSPLGTPEGTFGSSAPCLLGTRTYSQTERGHEPFGWEKTGDLSWDRGTHSPGMSVGEQGCRCEVGGYKTSSSAVRPFDTNWYKLIQFDTTSQQRQELHLGGQKSHHTKHSEGMFPFLGAESPPVLLGEWARRTSADSQEREWVRGWAGGCPERDSNLAEPRPGSSGVEQSGGSQKWTLGKTWERLGACQLQVFPGSPTNFPRSDDGFDWFVEGSTSPQTAIDLRGFTGIIPCSVLELGPWEEGREMKSYLWLLERERERDREREKERDDFWS